MALHHPNKPDHPDWVLDVKNNHFHKTCTIVQRMRATPENLSYIRALIDALEYEYLYKRRVLDIQEDMN